MRWKKNTLKEKKNREIGISKSKIKFQERGEVLAVEHDQMVSAYSKPEDRRRSETR